MAVLVIENEQIIDAPKPKLEFIKNIRNIISTYAMRENFINNEPFNLVFVLDANSEYADYKDSINRAFNNMMENLRDFKINVSVITHNDSVKYRYKDVPIAEIDELNYVVASCSKTYEANCQAVMEHAHENTLFVTLTDNSESKIIREVNYNYNFFGTNDIIRKAMDDGADFALLVINNKKRRISNRDEFSLANTCIPYSNRLIVDSPGYDFEEKFARITRYILRKYILNNKNAILNPNADKSYVQHTDRIINDKEETIVGKWCLDNFFNYSTEKLLLNACMIKFDRRLSYVKSMWHGYRDSEDIRSKYEEMLNNKEEWIRKSKIERLEKKILEYAPEIQKLMEELPNHLYEHVCINKVADDCAVSSSTLREAWRYYLEKNNLKNYVRKVLDNTREEKKAVVITECEANKKTGSMAKYDYYKMIADKIGTSTAFVKTTWESYANIKELPNNYLVTSNLYNRKPQTAIERS